MGQGDNIMIPVEIEKLYQHWGTENNDKAPIKDQVVLAYRAQLKQELERLDTISNSVEYYEQLSKFLTDNWQLTKNTVLSYNNTPDSEETKLCIALAESLAVHENQHLKPSQPRKTPFDYLMPGVKLDTVDELRQVRIASLTEENLQLEQALNRVLEGKATFTKEPEKSLKGQPEEFLRVKLASIYIQKSAIEEQQSMLKSGAYNKQGEWIVPNVSVKSILEKTMLSDDQSHLLSWSRSLSKPLVLTPELLKDLKVDIAVNSAKAIKSFLQLPSDMVSELAKPGNKIHKQILAFFSQEPNPERLMMSLLVGLDSEQTKIFLKVVPLLIGAGIDSPEKQLVSGNMLYALAEEEQYTTIVGEVLDYYSSSTTEPNPGLDFAHRQLVLLLEHDIERVPSVLKELSSRGLIIPSQEGKLGTLEDVLFSGAQEHHLHLLDNLVFHPNVLSQILEYVPKENRINFVLQKPIISLPDQKHKVGQNLLQIALKTNPASLKTILELFPKNVLLDLVQKNSSKSILDLPSNLLSTILETLPIQESRDMLVELVDSCKDSTERGRTLAHLDSKILANLISSLDDVKKLECIKVSNEYQSVAEKEALIAAIAADTDNTNFIEALKDQHHDLAGMHDAFERHRVQKLHEEVSLLHEAVSQLHQSSSIDLEKMSSEQKNVHQQHGDTLKEFTIKLERQHATTLPPQQHHDTLHEMKKMLHQMKEKMLETQTEKVEKPTINSPMGSVS